jgi:hypothetical protein
MGSAKAGEQKAEAARPRMPASAANAKGRVRACKSGDPTITRLS